MKTIFRLSLVALLLLLGSALPAWAQNVTTGTIERISPDTGVLTVRSNQTKRPVTFYGMDKAMLVQAQGRTPSLKDLAPGMSVTVQYAVRNNQWFVDKLIYGDEQPGGAAAVPPLPPHTTVPPVAPTRNISPVPLGRNRSGGNAPSGTTLTQ
jgi:hypothetical protein